VVQGGYTLRPSAARRRIFRRLGGLDLTATESEERPGGLGLDTWLALWQMCHEGTGLGIARRVEWPDGRALIYQPAIVVEMFVLISDEVNQHAQQRS